MATYFDRNTGKYYALRTNTGKVEEITGSALTHYHQRATATATELRNALGLNWRPFPWLSTSAQAGLNVIQRRDEIFEPRGAPNPTHGQLLTGSLASARGAAVVTSLNLLASVQKSLGGGFGLGIASGVNYTGRSIDDLDVAGRDLPEGTEALNRAATIYRVHDRQVGWATYGWYIEPTLNYHQRLRISPGIRLDGGSTFGTRLKLPSFPKVGVSYLISDEGFFPSALRSWVNSLRLRAAYGHAGRQPGPTDRLRLYGPKVTELIDRRPVDAVFLETLGNATLKPERSKEFEGGLDADVFDDRISLSVTGFRKTTVDALIDVPVAPSVYGAYVTQLRNIGVVRNTGLEMTIDIEPVRTDLLRWNAQVSMSRRRDVVVELGRGVEPFYVDGTVRVAPGYPLFSKWARPILGYADLDGDGVIEPREVLLGDTAVYVGSTLPNFTADLHTSLTFLRGALAVSASLHYEDGATQLNDVAYRLSHFGRSWNDPGAGAVALQPALLNETFSRYQTVNVLRVRSISVRYQAPTVVARRLGAQSVSVSLQGTNLGLWTNYRGVDPSVNAAATGNDLVDTGVLPMPRTWQLRVVATY